MRRCVTSTIVSLLALGAAACGDQTSEAETRGTPAETAPSAVDPAASEVSAEDFDPSRFGDSVTIDHRWYPLQPGKRLEYRGSSLEDGERLLHGVTIIVTDLTKVIDGVRNVVVWERDYTDGELVETELALFAQDREGNVWHLGQYPEEWEDGEFVEAPVWIHGVKGATAGITIPASPQTRTLDFAQGFAPPPLNWVDRGRVYKTGQATCVPAGCYDDVVVVEEYEKHIPEAYQDKFYAPGVGVVRVGWRGSNDESKEVLELIEQRQLTPAEMDEARAGALELEERAYQISKDVYGQTARSEGPGT